MTRCLSSLGKKRVKVHPLEIMHKYFTVRGGEEAFLFTFPRSLGTPALAVPRITCRIRKPSSDQISPLVLAPLAGHHPPLPSANVRVALTVVTV